MNSIALTGRLTRDPDVRYTGQGQETMCIARFTLAVDRRKKGQNGDNEADFPSCVCFGKTAEFFEKYVHQGMKMAVRGRIQTGSYTNKDNQKVYTTDVVVEEAEFCEKKQDGAQQPTAQQAYQPNPTQQAYQPNPAQQQTYAPQQTQPIQFQAQSSTQQGNGTWSSAPNMNTQYTQGCAPGQGFMSISEDEEERLPFL